nr:hypothetical protein [Tanacetum cinerariifolium]
KTQHSGVVVPGNYGRRTIDFYGILQEARLLCLGKTITRKETRALGETRKSCLNKKNLAFEVVDCSGRIVGDDSQRFITKGGCVMRKFAKLDVGSLSVARRVYKKKKKKGKQVTAIGMYEIAHYSKKTHKMVNEEAEKVLNELRTEEANSTLTPADIRLKQLKHIPGHINGRSASTRNILGNEKLRLDLESEKERSQALEENMKVMNKKQR